MGTFKQVLNVKMGKQILLFDIVNTAQAANLFIYLKSFLFIYSKDDFTFALKI